MYMSSVTGSYGDILSGMRRKAHSTMYQYGHLALLPLIVIPGPSPSGLKHNVLPERRGLGSLECRLPIVELILGRLGTRGRTYP